MARRRLANRVQVAVILAVLGGGLARADAPRSVASHGVRTLGMADDEARAMAEVVSSALARRGELVAADGRVVETCRGDRQCHCEAARREGADMAFFGNLGRISDIYTFELVVVDARSCGVDRAVFVSEQHGADSARSRLADLIDDVTTPSRQISTTASRREDRVEQVASPVVVMPASRLRALGVREIDDLVALVPGYEALDANWGSTILLWGLPTTILWMVEGVPLQDAQNPIRAFGRDLRLRLGHYDRVEFVLGPASTLWGSNALLGVVNFIGKRPARREIEAVATARAATPGTVEAVVSAAQRRPQFGYSVSIGFSAETTPKTYLDDSPFATFGVTEVTWGNGGQTEPEIDRYADLLARFEALDHLALVVAVSEYRTHFEISPLGPLLDEDFPGFWDNSLRLYSATWNAPIVDWLSYELSASRYEKLVHEEFVFQPPRVEGDADGMQSIQLHPTEPRINDSVDARAIAQLPVGPLAAQVFAGASYLYQRIPDSVADVIDLDEDPGALTRSFAAKQFHTAAGYAHARLSYSYQKLRAAVMGGTRYEWRDPLPSGITSQAGVVASLDWAGAKLLYSEGYRPPDALRLFSTVGTLGNPSLKPEKSRAVTAELSASLPGVTARVGAAFTRLTDLIVAIPVSSQPGFTVTHDNAGRIDILSGYAAVELDIAARLEGIAHVAYKHLAQSAELGEEIPVAPVTAGGGVAYWISRDLRAYGHGSMLWRRPVVAFEPTAEPAPPNPEGRRLPVDVRATVGVAATNLWPGLELDLAVSNPLRLTHYTPYQVDGRPTFLVEPRQASQIILELRYAY